MGRRDLSAASIADRLLGQYRSVLWGGVLIMLGHFTLALPALPFFYAGLALIVIGTGLLKPSVSTLVGSLYEPGDPRRDAGFSIFYMGINIGAMLGPLVAGYLAQRVDWHLGLRLRRAWAWRSAWSSTSLGKRRPAAGPRSAGRRRRATRAAAPVPRASAADGQRRAPPAGCSGLHRRRMGTASAPSSCFFLVRHPVLGRLRAGGLDAGPLRRPQHRLDIFGFEFPSSWFQSVQPFFVIMLAPIFAWLWIRLGSREPSVPAKFALGLLFMGLAFLGARPGGRMAQADGGAARQPLVADRRYYLLRARRAVPIARSASAPSPSWRRRASSA